MPKHPTSPAAAGSETALAEINSKLDRILEALNARLPRQLRPAPTRKRAP